jgi:hypothetical protein
MRWYAAFLVVLPAPAWAQVPSPSPPASSPPRRAERVAPEARRGFQMHIVPFTGVAFPFGRASDAPRDSLSARYSWHWIPLELGLGAKIIDELYLGAYFNVGAGWEGSDSHTESRCEAGYGVDDDVSCSSVSVHGGIELRYTFTPAEPLSGWVGYGVGATSVTQSISDAGRYDESNTAQGIEFARLSGGLDFRVKRGFGLGPYALVSVGRFVHQRTEIRNDVTFSGAIPDPALHAWLALGLRIVVFP